MGFLKKNKAPGELPDLVFGRGGAGKVDVPQPISQITPVKPKEVSLVTLPQAATATKPVLSIDKDEIRKQISDGIKLESHQEGFFDKILDDINGEIKDLGKLEEWYNTKFLAEDAVSNMKAYWEGNKTDIIIKSFGSEYKEKINAKIAKLQGLEEEWREIYFKLIKKEEEMKKEEKSLKDTLSEFVELCKRRRGVGA